MPRAYHRRSLPLLLALSACPAGPAPERAPEAHADPGDDARAGVDAGDDCAALAEAAERAQGCDPALAELAAEVRVDPDEARCREQARRLLGPSPSDARVHGVYEGAAQGPPPPLTEDERARLGTLPLPGILRISPDLPPAPGVPSTTVRLGDRPVSPRPDGAFLVHATPGEHGLRITHAAEQREFCVSLEPCAPVELIAHGAQLARNERLSPGACGQPGLTVAAGDG